MWQLTQSDATAARRRVPVYLLDDTDGKTPETGVSFSAGEIKISKNGAAEANHAGSVTEIAGGLYYYEFTSGEIDTEGFVTARFTKTGVRTFVASAQVRAASAGAADWTSTEKEQIRHRLGIDGTASAPGATPSLAASTQVDTVEAGIADIQSRLPAALVGGRIDASVGAMAANVVTAAAIATDAIDADAIAANAIDASALAADAVSEIWAGSTAPNAATIADAVWDEAQSGHVTAGTFGKFLDVEVSSRLATAGYTAPDNTTIASIQSDTNDIQARLPAALVGGRMDSNVQAMASGVITATVVATDAIDADALATDGLNEIRDAVWAAAVPGAFGAGQAGNILGNRLDVAVSTRGDATAAAQGTIIAYVDELESRLTAPRAANLDNLNAPISGLPSATQNADALLDRADGIETGLTPRGAFRLIAAASAGKLSGAATTTVTIRNVGDTKNRITATVDASGNRTAVTADPS